MKKAKVVDGKKIYDFLYHSFNNFGEWGTKSIAKTTTKRGISRTHSSLSAMEEVP